MMWGFFFSSTINLVILTLERYYKIVHPMKYINTVEPWKIRIALTIPWLTGPLYYVAIYTIAGQVVDGKCKVSNWPSQTMARAVGIVGFILSFFLPLVVMGYCYGRILKKIKNRGKSMQKYVQSDVSKSGGGDGLKGAVTSVTTITSSKCLGKESVNIFVNCFN